MAMEGIGNVAMLHKDMRVRIVVLRDTAPDHLDGMVGICKSWNQRRDLWNVELPSGEIEYVHPCRLEQYIDEPREPPARQHQVQREDVPRAPPENRVVLNCDSVGFVFTQSATRAYTGREKFSWDGVRRAFDYYATQGLRVLVAVRQDHLDTWGSPGRHDLDPLRRALTKAPVDDRIGRELVVGCWNQRRDLWNVELPSGEMEYVHPCRLEQYIDEPREPPARQHQVQREGVPRAPPENRVVLNCDSVGFVFTQSATRAYTGRL